MKVYPHVPSGSKSLDKALSKACPGFPRGRMSEVQGFPGTGKTVLMLAAACEVAKFDGMTHYIDTMGQLAVDHPGLVEARKDGRLALFSTSSFSQVEGIITKSIAEGVDLVVVDALGTLIGVEREAGEATFARSIAGMMKRVPQLLEGSNTALVFVNILRRPMHATLGEVITPGGKAFGFHMYRRLRLERTVEPPSDPAEMQEIRVKIVKDSMSPRQGKVTSLFVREGLIVSTSTKAKKLEVTASRFDREDPI